MNNPKIVPAADDIETTTSGTPPSALDWLEQITTTKQTNDLKAKKTKQIEEAKQKEQLEKMKNLDKKRSREMYEEIQRQIMLIRRKKKTKPAKYITAAADYDPQQHQDPETFWDKVKKKHEEAKKKLPWTSKQGMGSGEITRGVSG